MSKPAPLAKEVTAGEDVPFDGVILDTWATAELYTQRNLCFEVRALIRDQPPYEFLGGIGTGALLALVLVWLVKGGRDYAAKRNKDRIS